MPAKLDTSKPLRLIGVQIFEGTTKEVRKNLSPGWYRFVKCRNDDEIGTSRDVYPLVAVKNGRYPFSENGDIRSLLSVQN